MGYIQYLILKEIARWRAPNSEQDLGLPQFLFSLSGFSLSWGNRVALRRENWQMDLLQLNEKHLEDFPGFLRILVRTEFIQISEKTVQRTHDLKMLRMFQWQTLLRFVHFDSINMLQAMRRYTAMHLARIYPAGYRVDSSNYDPQDLQSPERNAFGSEFFSSLLMAD